jgi:hypothetical protein
MRNEIYEQKCIICDEGITNPICPNCLEREIISWVGELKPSLIPLLRNIKQNVTTFNHENTNCIICKQDMNVCPHCYCKEIYMWLFENDHIELANKFLNHFNFELIYELEKQNGNYYEHLN